MGHILDFAKMAIVAEKAMAREYDMRKAIGSIEVFGVPLDASVDDFEEKYENANKAENKAFILQTMADVENDIQFYNNEIVYLNIVYYDVHGLLVMSSIKTRSRRK